MKKREILATGTINKNGGLAMYMGEINEFFQMHKSKKVIARFVVVEKEASAALKGYYFNYVVPTFKQAIWQSGDRKTEEQTERFLRELSPIMYDQTVNDITGKYESRLREISELSNPELIDHIDFLKQLASEEYYIYIADPNEIV